MDTAGNVPWECFEKILPKIDLFFYDIKLFDSEEHRKYTGVGNEQILSNLEKLSERGARIVVRIPVIGGVNDNETEIQSIASYLQPLTVEQIELLPYHKKGEYKYATIGKSVQTFAVPSETSMSRFHSLFS